MFRRWLSAFWRDNKEKIMQIAKMVGILVLIATSAGLIFSSRNFNQTTQEEPEEIYKPQEVVISGGEILEEKFEKENTVIQSFVEFCNKQNFAEAYNLLTDKCKEKLYPTLQDFEDKYCKIIFDQKREYSVQGWVSQKNYNTYKISFTEDFMATGVYDGIEKYEDYITIVTDKENTDSKKININNYIKTEEINKLTNTDKLEIQVLNADIYMNYIIYKIRVNNMTDTDIVLDSLNSYNGIELVGTNGASYKIEGTNLRKLDLKINAGQTKTITLRFRKQYGSDIAGKTIKFTKVITDYSRYMENKENYNEFEDLSIKL